jgi:hypothetical protein
MFSLDILANIQYNARKKVNDQRKAYSKKRGINKKQAYFGDRYIKALAQVGTYAEGISLKKS